MTTNPTRLVLASLAAASMITLALGQQVTAQQSAPVTMAELGDVDAAIDRVEPVLLHGRDGGAIVLAIATADGPARRTVSLVGQQRVVLVAATEDNALRITGKRGGHSGAPVTLDLSTSAAGRVSVALQPGQTVEVPLRAPRGDRPAVTWMREQH